MKFLLAAALVLISAETTQANPLQPSSQLPDPATIDVPDTSSASDPKVSKDSYKFYYFYSSEVSFTEAYQDLVECRAHLTVAGPAAVPGFIAWDEAHRRVIKFPTAPTSLLASIILPKAERGMRSNKMRRCMGTRGYARYAISESGWNTLNEGKEQQLILMQAKLASGAKPKVDEVTE